MRYALAIAAALFVAPLVSAEEHDGASEYLGHLEEQWTDFDQVRYCLSPKVTAMYYDDGEWKEDTEFPILDLRACHRDYLSMSIFVQRVGAQIEGEAEAWRTIWTGQPERDALVPIVDALLLSIEGAGL